MREAVTPNSIRPRRSVAWSAALLVTALLLGGCGASASSPGTSPLAATATSAPPSATPTPPPAPPQATPQPTGPPPPPATPTPAPPPVSGGGGFVELTNVKRAGAGLPALAGSGLLDSIAAERAQTMATRDSLFHDLEYVVLRLVQLGACYTTYAETIASESGYPSFTAQRTVDAWWASPEHHAILAGDFNAAGGACAQARSGTYYAVMVFATLC